MCPCTIGLYLEPNPGGVHIVTSPDAPGLVTEVGTPAEIASNVQEALDALVEAWRELGKEPPPALRSILADRPQTFGLRREAPCRGFAF
jgi:antitoxin HicB